MVVLRIARGFVGRLRAVMDRDSIWMRFDFYSAKREKPATLRAAGFEFTRIATGVACRWRTIQYRR
jgi:hypothetical protein